MKEETKSKLKKYGKRAGFGVALVSLFLLGVGVGACSARKAVGSNAEDITEVIPEGENLLRYSQRYDYVLSLGPEYVTTTYSSNSDSVVLAQTYLHVGRYALVYEGDYDAPQSFVGGISTAVLEALDIDVSSDFSRSVNFKALRGTLSQAVEFIDIPSGFFDTNIKYLYMRVPQNLVGFYLVSDETYYSYAPSIRDVTFPNDYNPLSGFGTPSDGLIGQLGGSSTSPFRLNLYFRSGGHVFKRIDYYFLPMQGMSYVSALSSSGSPVIFSGNGFVYASMINYIALDGTTFLAWRAVFGVTSDGTIYLRNFGEWASKQYQTLNVVEYTPVLGQSGIAPNLDQVGILELRTASGVPTPVIGGDSNADVFSLLATGFNSVAGLMNIQILPFLTLGTLIFVPLVVMVIFAILKVLNK